MHSVSQCPTVLDQGEELVAFPVLFQRQVALTPNRLAIVHEDREFTYTELADLANQYAAELFSQGVDKGDCVGLCMDRSPEAIAAMIGVFSIGAAFVPLDPEYPVDRLAYMVADAQIRTVITNGDYRSLLESGLAEAAQGGQTQIRWIEHTPTNHDQLDPKQVDPDDLAYIMYTSGSTGQPKGVQIEHAALATYCYADIEIYKVNSQDRTLQFSTLNFDIAIEEIFPPLLVGSCIVVRPLGRSERTNELSDIVNRYDVTAIHLATAYWHEWVDLMVATGDRIPSTIRLMIVTGEKVSVEHYRRWQRICDHDVLWCNAYGPTEATVSATVFIPDESFDAPNMPIGHPMKRYDAYILDDQLRPIDKGQTGQTGQLYIGGPALARGYLNRDDLTEKAFIKVDLNGESLRLYSTGDLARWLPDGQIDFGGRIDHQIKLGSYRIEPGEIEAALDRCELVMESLVSYDTVENKKYLIAYVATGGKSIDPAELASFLRDQLPAYMIPARYVLVDAFLKTINGKIDRKALPDASTSVVARDSNYAAPRNELESKLVHLFQDVLNVPEVGIYDDFFLLGGSSLLVTQVVARLTSELDLELPVRDFFANPTAASAGKHIQRLIDGNTSVSESENDADITAQRERLPLVYPNYVASGDEQIFTVHYAPRGTANDTAVLLCPASGHEYQRSYRNLQQFAVQLAQQGYHVLRFDYAGTGNSQGDYTSATLERFRSNIQDAAGTLTQLSGCKQLSVIGVRLGATLAAQVQLPNLHRMICWDPIVDGQQHLAMLESFHTNALRGLHFYNQRRKRSAIDQLFGQQISKQLRSELEQLRLPDGPNSPDQMMLLSAGYRMAERSIASVAKQWPIRETTDHIQWHEMDHASSAFSSPHTYRAMLEYLMKGEF